MQGFDRDDALSQRCFRYNGVAILLSESFLAVIRLRFDKRILNCTPMLLMSGNTACRQKQVLPGTVWKVLGSTLNELHRYQVCTVRHASFNVNQVEGVDRNDTRRNH